MSRSDFSASGALAAKAISNILPRWCALAVLAVALIPTAVFARSTALVISNSNYADGEVPAARTAAAGVTQSFTALGIDVTNHSNLDGQAINRAVLSLANAAAPKDFVVVFYAGRVNRTDAGNVLVGTAGARDAAPLAALLTHLRARPPGHTLVVVDHAPSSVPLARQPDTDNVRVVFAAQPAKRAIHQNGRSVFASALAAELAKAGGSIEQVLKRISKQVSFLTGRKQQPWIAGAPLAPGVLAAGQSGGTVATSGGVNAPRMLGLTGGCFEMGSTWGETGRSSDEAAHQVCVGDFKLGETELTVAQFREFTRATGYRTEAERNVNTAGCWGERNGNWGDHAGASWQSPGFNQTENHPAVCLSWNDANAYVAWLSKVTGKPFRLPTEAEWEFAARGGAGAARYWGDDPSAACRYANVGDQAANRHYGGWTVHSCDDGAAHTAPAGRYTANGFGLKDMLGSVWEWTCSAYDASYGGGERNCASSAAVFAMRGGAWDALPKFVRAAARHKNPPHYRSALVGVRIAAD